MGDMYDLAIKSNAAITPEGSMEAVVLVKDGLIAEILTHEESFDASEFFNAGDHVLMPGVIDPHVHINEPGRTEWEGFNTATRAAISGGVTTLIDMPLNASPVTINSEALALKVAAAKDQLHCDCGFWGGIVPGNEQEIERLAADGVLGFKAFLTHSGIEDFPNVTEADLRKVMPLVAALRLPLLVHCELTTPVINIEAPDPASYQQYLASRPAAWEDNAIDLMIRLCREFRCRVHIVHLCSASALGKIRMAKEEGLPLTVETAQHYLYFNAEDIADGQTQFKCAPPIREKANNDLLWEALEQGLINFAATDHSPAPPALKHLQSGDFTKAWGGVASLQFALPVLWTLARKKEVAVSKVVQWLCEHPAELIGCSNTKGRIARGYHADLVVLNTSSKFTVTEDIIHHKHTITPYLGQELFGSVEQTWLSGTKVFDKPAFTTLNTGKIIRHT
jgi:allantoinase